MINRKELNKPLGYNLQLGYDDIVEVLKVLRRHYFNPHTPKSDRNNSKRVYNEICLRTGIGVCL